MAQAGGRLRLARSASVFALLLAACPLAAAAQDGAATVSVEELVVTAQKREQALIDVPQAVQAIQGSQLEAAGVSNLIDTVQMIPSASIPATISAGTEVYQIRSVAAGQAIGDSTVGFYLDEFAFSIPGLPFAPSTNVYDLARVEVVRGPSGTLYGQGSLGGTIKVITNDPNLERIEGSLFLSASSTSDGAPNGTASAMLNAPIVPGVLAVRGVLSVDHEGGYVDLPNLGQKDGNDKTEIFGRLKLLYTPTDKLRVTLGLWHDDVSQGFTNRMDRFDPPEANDTGPGESPLDYTLYTGDIEYDLGFATLLSSSGYLYQRMALRAVGSQPAFGNYDITTGTYVKSFSQEVRLTSASGGLMDWIVGAFYRDTDLRQTSSFSVTIPGLTATSDNTTQSEAWAVYGEVSLNLLDGALIPTIGGRWFEDDRNLDQNSGLLLFGPPQVVQGPFLTTLKGHNEAFSPRFNLAWHPNDDGMVYAEVAKGFRSGAIQGDTAVQALAALGVSTTTSLGPDTLWNYEVGTKWRLLDGRIHMELAAYQFDWKDAQLQYSPAGLSSIITAGDVRGRGLDLTLIYNTPIQGLTLQTAANINETELRNVPPAVSAPLPWVADGEQLPGTPRGSATVMANYRRDIGNGYHVTLNGSYSYRDKQRDIVTGAYSDHLGLIALRAGFGDERFDVQAFVENLTDDRGPSAVASGRYVIPYPRQFGVSLQARF